MVTNEAHEATIWTLMHDVFDHLDTSGSVAEGESGSQRDFAEAALKSMSPEGLAAERRTPAPLVEGFFVAVEGVGPAALMVMNDCRERVQRALRYAESDE
jgi:hypothetical protein